MRLERRAAAVVASAVFTRCGVVTAATTTGRAATTAAALLPPPLLASASTAAAAAATAAAAAATGGTRRRNLFSPPNSVPRPPTSAWINGWSGSVASSSTFACSSSGGPNSSSPLSPSRGLRSCRQGRRRRRRRRRIVCIAGNRHFSSATLVRSMADRFGLEDAEKESTRAIASVATSPTSYSTSPRSSSSSDVIPRAAVSIVVRVQTEPNDYSSVRYALIQRGKEPNRGMWSFPGGKIEVGEHTADAAMRELWEETRLGTAWKDTGESSALSRHASTDVTWHAEGAFTVTDSIHRSDDGGSVKYHYVISQCFAEAAPVCIAEKTDRGGNGNDEHQDEEGYDDYENDDDDDGRLPTLRSNGRLVPPKLVASDDAMDARWFSVEEVESGVKEGCITPGILRVLKIAESMYEKRLFKLQ